MAEHDSMQPGQVYTITLAVAGNIDAFTRPAYCSIIVHHLNHFIEHKDLRIYAWLLTTNRLYLMASAGKGNITRVLRDFKRMTGQQLLRAISSNPEEDRKEWLMRLFQFYSERYQQNSERHFWQFGNNPVVIEKENIGKERLRLSQIPVSLGVVEEPHQYINSSAWPKQTVRLTAEYI